ncbi:MAG: HD domain-containing protein [Candidatus Abyssobacteria bacterium SURF_5]|uniref:HD domain-containing protein n=1 Tax=Abyssobacteria bacterium (strain SURF_5) TaxID=2093360 RepID=A0A3A4NP44_ABYX5|nr:MAG: HD domain-containing protein [Candidatus Abyssubacteria bacterium SURF_5]
MDQIAEGAQFLPITLQSLRVDTVTSFDIYLRISERAGADRFVLYRARNILFTERALWNLVEQGIEQLFIHFSEKREYHRYLERNLETVLADDKVSTDDKSELAYTCATGLVEELLENPRSGEHIQRSKKLISNLANYLLTESRAFFSLMAATSFDYYTYTHSVNVAIFGMALSHRLGEFSIQEINTIGSGLILHDIGKSGIDRSILNKKGPLNKNEWVIMKQHPEHGVRLLREVGELKEGVLAIVADHHEKVDGSGYPRGLRGDAIHRYARIAALADIFDALTTARPYKIAEKTFPALQIMRSEMEGGLDQDLFREFVLLLGPKESAEYPNDTKFHR